MKLKLAVIIAVCLIVAAVTGKIDMGQAAQLSIQTICLIAAVIVGFISIQVIKAKVFFLITLAIAALVVAFFILPNYGITLFG